MKYLTLLLLACFLLTITFAQQQIQEVTIAQGQMPNLTKDNNGIIHIVYGKGDSILYVSSKDGKTFSSPVLIDVVPKLYSFAMRGPQIAATANGLVVTACTQKGNIFSYIKQKEGEWKKAGEVNHADETAKEGLMALSADDSKAYAVWLGAKKTKGQNVCSASSVDGGKTWSKKILVYASPDSTVCECCKPSVVVKNNKVFVMFRNQINGNRNLYLATSSDGGKTFPSAQKLGEGDWKLNACPMDGGVLVIDKNGTPQTTWRRETKIYAATPGAPEKEISEGRTPSIQIVNDKAVYAFTQNGNVIVLTPNGTKTELGKGNLPLLQTLNNNQLLCVWENDKQLKAAVMPPSSKRE